MYKFIIGCFLVMMFGCAEYEKDIKDDASVPDTPDLCEPTICDTCETCEEVPECETCEECEECPSCELPPLDPCEECFLPGASKNEVKACLGELVDRAGLCSNEGKILFLCPGRCFGFDTAYAPVESCEQH